MPNKLKKAKANDDVGELAKKEVNRLFRILWNSQNIEYFDYNYNIKKEKKRKKETLPR